MGRKGRNKTKNATDPVSVRCVLPDVEPALLAVAFSACAVEELLQLEVALGARYGSELRASAQHCSNWARAMRVEAGLTLSDIRVKRSGMRNDGSIVQSDSQANLVILSKLKQAFRSVRFSCPLEGGWRDLDVADVARCASVIATLHAAHPEGREIRDPDPFQSDSGLHPDFVLGRAKRLTLVHFDMHDIFSASNWGDALDFFREPLTSTPALRNRSAHARPVVCNVDGIELEVNVALNVDGESKTLLFEVDAECFHPYFREVGVTGSGRMRNQKDYLHVVCALQCGDIVRHSSCILANTNRGVQDFKGESFWHLCTFSCTGMTLSIEVKPCGGSNGSEASCKPFLIDENLGNAVWNAALQTGSQEVPIRCLEHENPFALNAFSRGSLQGAVALVRRGGGCGFAQKALAAQAAGAVGCIIYEHDGDADELGEAWFMGQRFGDVDYPAPKIPSILVHAPEASRLLHATNSAGGAVVRLRLERGEEAQRRLPTSLQDFRENVVHKEKPVHMAILVERARLASTQEVERSWGGVLPSWFYANPRRYQHDPRHTSHMELGSVLIRFAEPNDADQQGIV